MCFRPMGRLMRTFAVLAAVVTLITAKAAAQEADYGGYRPHYQGFGVRTPGGRGGTIYKVTNLNDAGPGSLRAALTATGPRFVIFEVSGTIALIQPIFITSPFLTIAGQTAPSPGILIRNHSVFIDTNDVVLQHLRLRLGDTTCVNNCDAGGADALYIRNNAFNIVLDHLSVSWGTHGNLSINQWDSGPAPREIAILDCFFAEGLAKKTNSLGVGVTSMPSAQGTWTHARNLHAHHGNRMPWVQFGWHFSGLNNVSYNAGNAGGIADQGAAGFFQVVGGANFTVPFETAWINNVAIPGPNTHTDGRTFKVGNFTAREEALANKMYLEGNVGPHISATNQWAGVTYWNGIQSGTAQESRVRTNLAPSWHLAFNYPVLPADNVVPYVIANAGARPLDRDAVDKRIVKDVTNRTGTRVASQNDVGGFPVLAQNSRALTVPASPHAVVDAAGRTRIEQWLEAYARALEPGRAQTLSTPQNIRRLN
jgi:hypothetical protein